MNYWIGNEYVYGLERAVKASGNPMRTAIDSSPATDKDFLRAQKLGGCHNGEGHDNFLKGVTVQVDIVAPLYWWKEAQRYHWFDFVSSESTMHCLLKFDVSKQCVDETDPEILKRMQTLIKEYNAIPTDDAHAEEQKKKWRILVASLPSGFCLGATMVTNYQQLKTMYIQRRHHKLTEWHVFCAWCEKLPHFLEITSADKFAH
jgi:hypothetical protein